MSIPVTLTGRLTADPEMKIGKSGKPVTRFTVVTSRRVKNNDTNEWTDEGTSFWNCTAFGQLAENIAESLVKGTAVLVTGRAEQESWQDREGNKRTGFKVIADEVAPSLKWATAKVSKAGDRTGNANQQQGNGGQRPQQAQQRQPAAAQSGWGGGTSYSDQPPF